MVCPHPGCGKPLVGPSEAAKPPIRRPPPPGPVRLSPAAASPPAPLPARPATPSAPPPSPTRTKSAEPSPVQHGKTAPAPTPVVSAARASGPNAPAEANDRRWLLFVLSLLVLLGFVSWAGYSAWRRGAAVEQNDSNVAVTPHQDVRAHQDSE